MGSHSFVKSESWLDVSRIVQREEGEQNDQHSQRSSTQPADGHQTSRRPIERAISLEPTVRSCWPTERKQNNRHEHLLIRLRQQSFIARSNSTTLSSNLSQSVDLEGSLVDQSNSTRNFRRADKCEGSTFNKPTHHQINATRRELSSGLKAFRDRFERRWQQMRRSQARKQANYSNSDSNRHRSRETSPFARSWSSLSEQVSSRLTNIGHACKSLLYECQKPHCDSGQFEPDESRPNATRPMSPMPTRKPVNLNDSDQLNVSTFRRRLTSQWVAQQCEAQRGELGLAVEDEDQNQLIRLPIRESDSPIELHNRSAIRHATPTPSDGCRPQPRSVSRRESSRSSREATGGKHETECKLASHLSARTRNGAAELSSPLTQRSHSTSSSTTLVSVTKRSPQQSRPETSQGEEKRNSLPALERLLRLQTNSSSNTFSSSSSTKTTMSSNVSQTRGKFGEKLAQASRNSPTTPVATSDYWSSVKSELAPSMAPVRDHHQSDQLKRNQRNFEPTPMLSMASDQDYYLDVATAANFQQQQVMTVDMQQQQQQLFEPLTSQEPAFLTAEFDDYDDYAVPADESCCRLERSQVELVQLIGEGQKGYVFVGKLQSKDGQSIIDVAIKTLKFETEQLIERLMNEAAMMKQLEHPHIIKFIGMCPETPALIAMELAKFGEIKHYFRLNRQLIKCSQLVLFSFQISTALSYLESKNYVHRDVAARNVLVCSHNCVKLADFGLSRNLQTNYSPANSPQNTYNQQDDLLNHHHQNNQHDLYVAAPRVKLPVRWLAPESLVFRRFTSASDVWMFSVCTWEFFKLAQVRPWAELRNNQVLTAIESGQRLGRPEACPERLYQLMLKCWSYAPVQRPKFREIKQCIWSIYLSERTREQLELERLEQERQQRLMLIQQQHLHQAQVPLLATSNKSRHEQLSVLACDATRGHAGERRLSPNTASQQAAATRLNHTPSSNYSSTLTTTTTDTEQMISPCSSAFNSMAREAAQREIDKKQQQANLSRSSALKTAISRFEQRQSPVGGASKRPHVLQKQRSQGAIGMATSRLFEDGATLVCDSANIKRNPKASRRSGQMQPIFDDGALEYAKRIARTATNLGERRSVVPANKLAAKSGGPFGVDGEDFESEIEESDDENEGALWARAQRFVSASPALTADAGSQSRVVSIEPAYDGVFSADHHKRAFLMPGDQIAMLRNNFDPSDGSRLSPQLMSSPALTSSNSPTRSASWRATPTASNIETNNNNFNQHHQDRVAAQRVASGKKPQLNPSSQNKMRVSPQPDQLGQMLQALRITPMKAKLRSSPEQNVRVLQREEKRPTFDEFERPLERHDSSKRSSIARRDQVVEPQPQQQQDGQAKQLMLHERLLGRIRPSSSSPSPIGGLTTNQRRDLGTSSQQQQQQQRRPTSQVVRDKSDAELARLQHGINSRLPHQNKSVEAVDHSLQILESLMLGNDVIGPGGTATSSSLPRRSHR